MNPGSGSGSGSGGFNPAGSTAVMAVPPQVVNYSGNMDAVQMPKLPPQVEDYVIALHPILSQKCCRAPLGFYRNIIVTAELIGIAFLELIFPYKTSEGNAVSFLAMNSYGNRVNRMGCERVSYK